MSTAPPSLLRGLLDDAALLSHEEVPAESAVARHLEQRPAGYAEVSGPLLVPTRRLTEVIDALLGDGRPRPAVPVVVCGPDPASLHRAVELLAAQAPGRALVTGVALPYGPDWRAALTAGVTVSVELGPSLPQVMTQIGDVAEQARASPVRAALSVSAGADLPAHVSQVLAGCLLGCARRRLPFTLTGGLDRTITLPSGSTEARHGLLNVLLATDLATAHVRGAVPSADAEAATPLERVVATLVEQDADDLVDRARALSAERVSSLRWLFAASRSARVDRVVSDLIGHGLLPQPA